jgi:hypothetical protein
VIGSSHRAASRALLGAAPVNLKVVTIEETGQSLGN